MSDTPTPPNPVNPEALKRASIIGAILGVFGIISFVVIWVLLGQTGTGQVPRILLSLCIPPAMIGLIMLAYLFYLRSRPRL